MKYITILSLMLWVTACQQNQPATKPDAARVDWKLMVDQSTLSFVSTKNKVATEEHSIEFQSGNIIGQNFELIIDLNSVDTLIPIRDQRMRNILFETETYPTATISQELPEKWLLDDPFELTFQLDLHGQQKEFTAAVIVQEVGDQLVVVNYEPILVNAKDFNLDDGINQLTKIAGLQSINYEVLVDFKLTFEKSGI